MPPEIALDPAAHPAYAFNRLSKPANILVMPAIHSAAISTKLVQALGGGWQAPWGAVDAGASPR